MTQPDAFIVMQFGNAELDGVCDDAIIPAIKDAGLTERRVDRDHGGRMLKSEIVDFLTDSEIIVADLTNERPNCYLEVGYAMGLRKHANLVLTVREDHHHHGKGWSKDGPQVHFDLAGYPLIFWSPDDLPKFRSDLAEEIKRRREALARQAQSPPETVALQDRVSVSMHPGTLIRAAQALRSEIAFPHLPGAAQALRDGRPLPPYFEVAAEIHSPISVPVGRLTEIQWSARVEDTGWPFGTVDYGGPARPRVMRDGIVSVQAYGGSGGSLDCSKLTTDGQLWVLRDLDDRLSPTGDANTAQPFFADIQTRRVAEALLFVTRLYRRLGATDRSEITVELHFNGLEGRRFAFSNPRRSTPRNRICYEQDSTHQVAAKLADLEIGIARHTRQIISEVLVLFDGIEIPENILDEFITPVIASANPRS